MARGLDLYNAIGEWGGGCPKIAETYMATRAINDVESDRTSEACV